MTDISPRPTPAKALELMRASMPPFEAFLEHATTLKGECEKAGELTPERAALFDIYKEALATARGDYENSIADLICENFFADEVDLLITCYTGPMHKALEKALGLAPTVNNLGTLWQTKVLESCPDVWKMLMDNVGLWQRKNTPEAWDVTTADVPPSADTGWKKVEPPGVKQAEEYVPGSNGNVVPIS